MLHLVCVVFLSTLQATGGLSEGIEVSLDPSELELDASTVSQKSVLFWSTASAVVMCDMVSVVVMMVHYRYEEQLKEQQNQLEKEDLSDMVAEHAARQKVSL